MADNSINSEVQALRILACTSCNRRVTEDFIFCLESELPISEMTSNVALQCPLEKF